MAGFVAAVAVALAALAGCAVTGQAGMSPGAVASPAGGRAAAHPPGPPGVVIQEPDTGRQLTWSTLQERVAAHGTVLLGERHDNPEHHRVRARLISAWLAARPQDAPAVVFEQLDREHQPALQAAVAAYPWTASPGGPASGGRSGAAPGMPLEVWLDAARFDRKAWRWPLHRPLFEAAGEGGGHWVAANFSRASARAMMRPADGRQPEPPAALTRLLASADWPDTARAALAESLRIGHCHKLPETAIPAVARMQQLRDAALAEPLQAEVGRPALLIAGNGHVRRDHGVPRYLGAAAGQALVVGFEEHGWAVRPGHYDIVVLTAAPVRETSGCEGL